MPVSAIVKTSGAAAGLGSEAAERLVNVLVLGMPSILQDRLPTLALVGLAVVGILFVARERECVLRVPAPVLAEVCRSTGLDAAVQRVLNIRGVVVVDLTAPISRHAGRILARAKLDSAHAVDAFVVATAARFESAIIATHDPDDLTRLAAGLRNIEILKV